MTDTAIRTFLVRASTILLTLAGTATAVGQPAVRAILQPASERKAAPQLALKNSTGKTISLTDYRGGIQSLPDTFLIDRQGRVAAAYRAGLVDKNDVEANIKVLLSQR